MSENLTSMTVDGVEVLTPEAAARKPQSVRMHRTMGAGVWSLLAFATITSGIVQPPEPRCPHGIRLSKTVGLCGCTEAAT